MGCTNFKETQNTQKVSTEKSTTSFSDIRKIYRFSSKPIVRTATLIQDTSSNPKKFAIKIIAKEKLKKKKLQMLQVELGIIKKLDHPNIVKFFEAYQDERFFYLVMEFLQGGELIDRIGKRELKNEYGIALVMRKIFLAVEYLHNIGICHRDLKPENLLFSSKVIDFGLSRQFRNDDDFSVKSMKTAVGTPYFVAPEVLKQKYDYRCDVWSLGVILYFTLSGDYPFKGRNRDQVFDKILNADFDYKDKVWKNISGDAQDLIKHLICVDVSKRYTLSKALQHRWFTNYAKEVNMDNEKIDPEILENLQNYKATFRFKKETLKVAINLLTEKEIKKMRDAFQIIDKDKTGLIKTEEIYSVLKDLGYFDKDDSENEKEKITKLFNRIGVEDKINYTEFITATLDKKHYLTKEKLWNLFCYFDVDNSGYITLDNLKEILAREGRKVSVNELKEMIKEIDIKNDNRVSFEEFIAMMTNDPEDNKNNKNLENA